MLHEEPGARPAGRHAGLYHYALLYPSREELARRGPAPRRDRHADLRRLGPRRLGGDLPARPGRQRDRALRRPPARRMAAAGARRAASACSRARSTCRTCSRRSAAPSRSRHAGPGLRIGHVHLHVGDVGAARDFYRGVLGFETMAADAGRAVPRRRRLPPPPGREHLARRGRRPGARRAPSGCASGRSCSTPAALAALHGRLAAAGLRRDGELITDPWGIPVRVTASG